jgi:cobalamin biosynthesis protein CobT
MDKHKITEELLQARQTLVDTFRRELLGPGSEVDYPDVEHELISESPQNRYSVGILYPRDKHMSDDNDGIDTTSTDSDNSNDSTEQAELAAETVTDNNDDSVKEKNNDEFRYAETEGTAIPERGDSDQDVTLARQNKPSSIGMTFFVKTGVKK